jgi:hypothetical protein
MKKRLKLLQQEKEMPGMTEVVQKLAKASGFRQSFCN